MRQGEPGQDFVIAEGAKATVSGSGSALLGPGDVVGEMSSSTGPRSATVTAWTDMHLLVLTPGTSRH